MHTKNEPMELLYVLVTLLLICTFFTSSACAGADSISLAGKWSFRLDPDDEGVKQKWFQRRFEQKINLPGTTDENDYGKASSLEPTLTRPVLQHLTRQHRYIGPAWYQRTIDIPVNCKGKTILLTLERVIWETRVWVDGKQIGLQDSLVVPHRYDLTSVASPGEHTLTIRVDNSQKYNIGTMAHAYTDETQTIWNGIIGDISLQARDLVRVEDVQIYPDVSSGKAALGIIVQSSVGRAEGTLTVSAKSTNTAAEHIPDKLSVPFTIKKDSKKVKVEYDMGEGLLLWDEFAPNLYDLTVNLEARAGSSVFVDTKKVRFGMREFTADEGKLKVNDRPVFLRGTLECCIFPLTGHPPMDKAGWRKVLEAAKSYGLNHLRFHSWCPPEAAFAAADEMGFYLQPELPVWINDMGKDRRRDQFLQREAGRILKTYGNHPSFCLMSMGNELEGDFDFIHKLVKYCRQTDPRHLYTSTTYSFQGKHGKWPEPVDDFFISQQTLKGWIRGQGFFNNRKPSTSFDFRASLEGMPVPVISHEIGQYAVYPNLDEIEKYTGVLEPLNFIAIRRDLEKKGRLHLADEYLQASGKFSVLLYKEDIEMAMRTPGISGFQLLDLHDFSGQGTALVGTLDAFWESKGLIEPAQYRGFCGPTVPLVRMDKLVFVNDEPFTAEAEVFHYGSEPLNDISGRWKVTDTAGRQLFAGVIPAMDIPVGGTTELGKIELDLSAVKAAKQLNISVELGDTGIRNDWDFWVYPAEIDISQPDDVLVADSFNDRVESALQQGGRVIILAGGSVLKNRIPGRFVPVFWSPVHFPHQPGTMGVLCDPDHPALTHFPTDFHSNWQWWQLATRSVSVVLEDVPSGLEPIVRTVDNFARNANLASVFEARVGKGSLLVCSIDLKSELNTRPVARQLRHSLFAYVASDKFQPTAEASLEWLKGLFKEPTALASLGAKVVSVDSAASDCPGRLAIDDDPETIWHTPWSPQATKYPHEIVIDLGSSVEINGFTYLPRQDANRNGWVAEYEFYVSEDGRDWGKPVAAGSFARDSSLKKVIFHDTEAIYTGRAVKGRFIRFLATKGFDDDPYASAAELDLILD